MPWTDYPKVLKPPYGPFPDIAARVAREVPQSQPQIAQLDLKSHRDAPVRLSSVDQSGTTGITRTVIYLDRAASVSFNNNPDSPIDTAVKPFCFCPGADAVRIGWTLQHSLELEGATIEVQAARLKGAIATFALTASALTNGADGKRGFTGSAALSALEWADGTEEVFPDRLFTVEHSPYRVVLKAKVKARSRYALFADQAWTFFHVLVSGLTIDYGEEEQIPFRAEGDEAPYDNISLETATRLEHDLLQKLKEGTTTSPIIEVVLDCNLNKGKLPESSLPINTELDKNGPGSHHALQAVWGKGPRIPLVATARVKRIDGRDASPEQSARALGRPWFMWDWRDEENQWISWIDTSEVGDTWISRRYIQKNVERDIEGTPFKSRNCPADRGGRRGNNEWPIFPAQKETGKLGYEVKSAGEQRPWASCSRAGKGTLKGTTGAIFQPSCILGDVFKVRVWLTALPGEEADDKPCLIRPDEGQPLEIEVYKTGGEGKPPSAATGRFVVYRVSKLKLVYAGQRDDDMIGEVLDYYKKSAGFILDLETIPLPGDIWHHSYDGGELWKSNLEGALTYGNNNMVPWMVLDLRQPRLFNNGLIAGMSYRQVLDHLRQVWNAGEFYYSNRSERGDWFGCKQTVARKEVFILAVCGEDDIQGIPQGEKRTFFIVKDGTRIVSPQVGRFCFSNVVVNNRRPERRQKDRTAGITFTADNISTTCTISFGKWDATVTGENRLHMQEALALLSGKLLPGKHALTVLIEINDGKKRKQIEQQTERVNSIRTILPGLINDPEFDIMAWITTQSVHPNDPPFTEFYYYRLINDPLDHLRTQLTNALQKHEYDDYQGLIYLMMDRLMAKDYSTDGAFVTFLHDALRGIAYHRSGGAGARYLASGRAGYYEKELFIHEMGHAFWRGHAPMALFVNRMAESGHINHDTCVMNYDPDPTSLRFCGRCILELRGWKDLPDEMEDHTQCKMILEAEIQQTQGTQLKAWRQMRRAYMGRDDQDASQWITRSLRTWGEGGNNWNDPYGLSLLREAVVGYKTIDANEEAARAWELLQSSTDIEADVLDGAGRPLGP